MKILIGGQELRNLGSDRYTEDVDYLINDLSSNEAFIINNQKFNTMEKLTSEKLFNVRVAPKNEGRFWIFVKSHNYPYNVDTVVEVDRKTMEVCADIETNCFLDARKFIKDLSKEMKMTLGYDRINKYGMYL